MKSMLGILLLGLAFAGSAQAGGEWQGGKEGFAADEAPIFYAKGCYWRRGTRYCSSYCYIEINGKHYCNSRESEAVPQGDPYHRERPTVEDIYRQPRYYR